MYFHNTIKYALDIYKRTTIAAVVQTHFGTVIFFISHFFPRK